MRPLKSHLRPAALTTFESGRTQMKEARDWRRAPAVRAVVAGHHGKAVSAMVPCAHAALRTWGQRFAPQGPQGLWDHPRSGRPRNVTCVLAQPLTRLGDPAPLEHGALHAPWRGRALAAGFARETGGPLGWARGRGLVKPHTSQNALLERLRWYHRHVR
jgi:transposase